MPGWFAAPGSGRGSHRRDSRSKQDRHDGHPNDDRSSVWSQVFQPFPPYSDRRLVRVNAVYWMSEQPRDPETQTKDSGRQSSITSGDRPGRPRSIRNRCHLPISFRHRQTVPRPHRSSRSALQDS